MRQGVSLFRDIERLGAAAPDGFGVGVSGGKDSIVLLDLCRRYIPNARLACFFQYIVPELGFQERYLAYLERRYSVDILRLPHWMLSTMYRNSVLRFGSKESWECPKLTIVDIENDVRARSGVWYIATGQKKSDSLQRRGMISANGAIDEKTGRAMPLAEWTNRTVYAYIRRYNIPLPPDYSMFGHSMRASRRRRSYSVQSGATLSNTRRASLTRSRHSSFAGSFPGPSHSLGDFASAIFQRRRDSSV